MNRTAVHSISVVSLHWRITVIAVIALWATTPRRAAGDTGAVASGDWSNPATWTNGVPGANVNAYIGSTNPAGAAAIATVNLSQDSSVGNLYLGNGAGTSGTLDLNGFNLDSTDFQLYLGTNGGAGSIQRTSGGTLSSSDRFNFYGGSLALAPGDSFFNVYLHGDSALTTAATSNINGILLQTDPGGTLTLGADLSLAFGLNLQGTLNANGHAIATSAQNSSVGLGTMGRPCTVNNRGPITTPSLFVSSQYSPSLANFNLISGDIIGTLGLNGVTSTFAATASVQDLNLDSDGNTPPTYSTVTTSATSNLTGSVAVNAGCTLKLGADLTLSGNLSFGDRYGSANCTLDAGGHAINVSALGLGGTSGPFALLNRGPITVGPGGMDIRTAAGQSQFTFDFTPADTIKGVLELDGVNSTIQAGSGFNVLSITLSPNSASPPVNSTLTTSATSNVTDTVVVNAGSTLNLGADLNLTSSLNLRGNLNVNGHAISAPVVDLGVFGGPFMLTNRGPITSEDFEVSSRYSPSQTTFNLMPSDIITEATFWGVSSTFAAGTSVEQLNLYSNQNSSPNYSTVTVKDAAGQMTGLTISGQPASSLSITSGSDLVLETNGLAGGWVLEWANPSGGNHIADLQKLINAGEISFAELNGGGYALTTDSTYTYVSVISVPEPSALLLAAAAAGLLAGMRRRFVTTGGPQWLPHN